MAATAPTWQSCLSLSHLSHKKHHHHHHDGAAIDPEDDSAWLRENLQTQLHYDAPLPIQQRLVPVITHHLQSSLPLDLSLTAPTGSGKTLCYLLPLLLYLVAQDKKYAMANTVLRGLVLVPTRALGQQVYREALRLTAKTNIKVVQLCDEGGGASHPNSTGGSGSIRAEGAQLVREVVCGSGSATAVTTSGDDGATDKSPRKLYYSLADLIIATPQRLLRHLDYTEGFTLRHLKLCVVDEADQLLAVGNFANLISKIIRRQEEEVRQYYDAVELEAAEEGEEEEQEKRLCRPPARVPPPRQYPILQKVMCSATLTSRIARTSEMNLHNCQYYVLDSNGDLVDHNTSATAALTTPPQHQQGSKKQKHSAAAAAGTAFALPPKLQEHIVLVETKYKPAALLKLVLELTKKISAAMWEKQKQSREARERQKQKQIEANDDDDDDDDEEKREDENEKAEEAEAKYRREEDLQYPTAHDVAAAGPSIIIFAGSAEDARVVGHFLANSGFTNILEFTILTQLAERQKALLGSGGKYNPHFNPHHQRTDSSWPSASATSPAHLKSYLEEAIYYFPLLLVATDALVRGIDIPQVGHVINYEAPRTLQSYIHRAGRTARALRCGHVHTLLNAKRSATSQPHHPPPHASQREKEETEYDMYQTKINPFIARTLPLRYERTFFKFERETVGEAVKEHKIATTATPKEKPEKEQENEKQNENEEEAVVVAGDEEQQEEQEHHQEEGETTAPPATTTTTTQENEHADNAAVAEMSKKPFSVKWYIKEADTYMNASVLSLSDFWGSALQHKQNNNNNNNNNNNKVSTDAPSPSPATSKNANHSHDHPHNHNNNNNNNHNNNTAQKQRHGHPKRGREEGNNNKNKNKPKKHQKAEH